jgi:DNA polymerase III subunit delta'
LTTMSLRPLYGHDAIRDRLSQAVRAGRLPQAILLHGPRGVGKQRLGLWLGQLILCEKEDREPCGKCQACRMAENLSHPDLHWFIPIEPSKKAGDADKQVELVEAALGEELALRRERPLYGTISGLANHSVATARLLLRRISLTPAMGRRKIFLIGDAERLIPQQANPEAANALLKALEEPPADTVLILTAAEPDKLLPTVLSRVVRTRVLSLPDSVVTSFAQAELPDLKNQARVVAQADGCIGRLLAQLPTVGGGWDAAEAFQTALLGTSADRYAAALRQAPFQARGGFTDMLDGLVERLRREAKTGADTARIAEAIALVLEARERAQGNVNPQLLTAVLSADLAAT